MSYQALYRKWRPKVFEEVVGQEAITSTLRNQVRTGTIGHAYLFSGTRGTGKTTSAKIFSRVINCLAPVDANPCNECDICKGILDESLMDVVEIDAASNNGVDDIRELRENVKYPPSKAKYKVYIIDEVHMLSTGAFNALLKTLEEPPHYVVFILATTEPHKLPATILSRCQRFDFKRVGASDQSLRMRYIAEQQGFSVNDAALNMIFQKSDGAVRDALSMLDQCFSYGEQVIDEQVVSEALGLVNREMVQQLVDHMIKSELVDVFQLVQEMITRGKNISQFVKDFIEYYRDLLMIASAGRDEKLIRSGAPMDLIGQQADQLGLNRIWSGLQHLLELDNAMKWSANTRVLLEMALVKMTQATPVATASVDSDLEARVKQLEKALQALQSGRGNSVSPAVSGPSTGFTGTTASRPTEKPTTAPVREAEGDTESDEASGPIDPLVIQDKWGEVLQFLKKRKVSLYAFLVEGTLVGTTGKIVQVGFKDGFGFHLNAISQEGNRQEVERAIKQVTGYAVRMQFDYLDAFQGQVVAQTAPEAEEDIKRFLGDESNKLEVIE